MNSLDPSVSYFLVFLFLIASLIAGLAEQYFHSLNENKLDFASRQGLKSAVLLQKIYKRRIPQLSDTIWLAKITFLGGLGFAMSMAFSASVNLSHFGTNYAAVFLLGKLVIISAVLVCGLVVLPRFLQHQFKRKYIGQLFFSLQIGCYFLFAVPCFFTLSLIRFFCARIFSHTETISLLIPLHPRKGNLANGFNPSIEKLEPEVTLLQNALDFSKVRVRECMVPRNEIVAIDIESDISFLKQKFAETHFSKILIYKESSDNIVGYVHSYDLFKKPTNLKSILLPVFIVPETINAQEVFELFVKQKRSIAIVVDEFGGTSGMLTVEDVMEKIFGEIDDEHDISEHYEEKLSSDRFIFSGRLEIEYLNEKYGLNIPESENYDTLAGFIVEQLDDIPDANACFETEQFLITVTKVSDAKIELIDLKVKAEN